MVGLVTENGLTWFRNGAYAGKNAPHVEPADYHFHGTVNPVHHYTDVDYQDFFDFRHNLGPGGSARVSFAGSIGTLP